jgi:hypothetical protein
MRVIEHEQSRPERGQPRHDHGQRVDDPKRVGVVHGDRRRLVVLQHGGRSRLTGYPSGSICA